MPLPNDDAAATRGPGAAQPGGAAEPAGARTPGPARSLAGEYAVAGLLGLALYLASMAPGVLWQDSGLAQVRVMQRDIRGPLGLALSHPLYYVLAIGFQSLPFDEPAFKTNLVSAVFGALTVANVFLLLRLLTGRRVAAAGGALALAVAHTFWQHCALAEVYTVTTALLTLELLCWVRFERTGRAGWLVALYAANGLGVSNHLVALLSLACYGVLTLWLVTRRRIGLGALAGAAAAWLAGAGLYIGLIIADLANGAAAGETLRSALFGNTYADNVLNVMPTARMLLNSALILALNFPTPAVLLVIPGLLALRRLPSRSTGVLLALLLAIHLVWAVRYDVPDQYTFFIPAIVLLAVVIGLGAERFVRGRGVAWRAALIVATALPVLVYIPLPQVARRAGLALGSKRDVPYRDAYAYFLRPWKTGYRGAERFARELHDTLPDGAVLLVQGDTTAMRPVQYWQLTGRWTRDVRVVPDVRTPQPWPRISADDVRDALDGGRLYVLSPMRGYCPDWVLDDCTITREGLAYRVGINPGSASAPAKRPPDR